MLFCSLRIMFWTTFGAHPSITLASMDGIHVREVINTNIEWPYAVAIDYSTNYIYWVDADRHLIECSDFNGLNRKVVLKHNFLTFWGYHILVREGFIYWSDLADFRIYKAWLPDPSKPMNYQNVLVLFSLDQRYDNKIHGFTIVDLKSPRVGGKI